MSCEFNNQSEMTTAVFYWFVIIIHLQDLMVNVENSSQQNGCITRFVNVWTRFCIWSEWIVRLRFTYWSHIELFGIFICNALFSSSLWLTEYYLGFSDNYCGRLHKLVLRTVHVEFLSRLQHIMRYVESEVTIVEHCPSWKMKSIQNLEFSISNFHFKTQHARLHRLNSPTTLRLYIVLRYQSLFLWLSSSNKHRFCLYNVAQRISW